MQSKLLVKIFSVDQSCIEGKSKYFNNFNYIYGFNCFALTIVFLLASFQNYLLIMRNRFHTKIHKINKKKSFSECLKYSQIHLCL